MSLIVWTRLVNLSVLNRTQAWEPGISPDYSMIGSLIFLKNVYVFDIIYWIMLINSLVRTRNLDPNRHNLTFALIRSVVRLHTTLYQLLWKHWYWNLLETFLLNAWTVPQTYFSWMVPSGFLPRCEICALHWAMPLIWHRLWAFDHWKRRYRTLSHHPDMVFGQLPLKHCDFMVVLLWLACWSWLEI